MEATLPDWMVERFVQPRPDCWIWTGATDRGYGMPTPAEVDRG